MAFNSLGQYTANHKVWDHVGNIVPTVEYSEGTRPHGEYMPSAWLPVQFYDKHYEDWVCVMPGKGVAFDNAGRLCPAQYGLSGATVTYTTNDVTAGVIDVRTGAPLLAGNVGTFNVSSVSSFMGTGVAMSVTAPVGVCPYPYLQWAGNGGAGDDGNNPAYYRQHNYNRQHRVAILCDYVLELPVVPAQTASANLTQASFSGHVATMNAVANLPVATNTLRTPITFANGTLTDASARFLNQVSSVANISSSGDWFIDYTTGVISVYANATLGGGNIYTVTYSNYASAPTGSNVSKFACVVGNVQPGQFLKMNADSNWVVATPVSQSGTDDIATIMGQALDVDVYPKDALDRVRTAYATPLATNAAGSLPGYAGQMDQMPGSADGGVSDKINYAGAADKVIRINLISR